MPSTPTIRLMLFAVVMAPLRLDAADSTPAQIEFFEKRIRPVLANHCYECHSTKSKGVKGGLLLDSRDAMHKGGDSGPVLVPGDVEASLLLESIRYEGYEMPPAGKLPEQVIADFEKWVKMGAPDPRTKASVVATQENNIDFEAARSFWSFKQPVRGTLEISQNEWVRNGIDPFVWHRLQDAGMRPNELADRRTFIRRATFDLVGLPPTYEEVEEFVNDPKPDAKQRLIERLIGSAQFGERWARVWLDVARYAEDQAHIVGNNKELFYPNAYRYRDWVIDALNRDLPYDEFIKLQLAGDLYDPSNIADLPALGFIGLGPKYYRRSSPEVMADEWEDRVDVVTRGLQGLTVACARCHDHKYDPITTEDYYALAGVFASTEMYNHPLTEKAERKKGGHAKEPDEALHIIRDTNPTDLNVYIRGDVNNKGAVVARRFLKALASDSNFENGSGRRELAEQIANRTNPLTARVVVNRIWKEMIGRPLVATTSNFGKLGERPTHPELLDDLAVRFMDEGAWSIKWLIREIVLSATYGQSSVIDADDFAADPDNKLLWRMNRRRLPVESWRDSILAIAGRLDESIGGKSIKVDDPDTNRRGVYAYVSRLDLDPMLALFDFPDPNAHSAGRTPTITPIQKMFLLNSTFMVSQARAAVDQIEDTPNVRAKIEALYRLALSRNPADGEIELALNYLKPGSADASNRWIDYAQALLASNEMMFID